MDLVQKFYSDVERIKKHNRDGSGKLNVNQVKTQIVSLFENNNRNLGELAHSLTELWILDYVTPMEQSGANEFSAEVIDKIACMYAFLIGDEQTDSLTNSDWKKIAEAVNYEAEELPMESLSQMMSILVEKRAF